MQDNTTEEVEEEQANESPDVCDNSLIIASSMEAVVETNVIQNNLEPNQFDDGLEKRVCIQDVNEGNYFTESANDSILDKQQSLEEELLMEEELLKGEDDDTETVVNTEDIILDEDSIMTTVPSQQISPVAGSQTANFIHSNCEERLDLDINIDSLLASSGVSENNVNIDINESELLNEEDVDNQICDVENKDVPINKMVYDEDSLLRELDSNINEDVVLDENVDSLLASGESQPAFINLNSRIDDCDDNLSNVENGKDFNNKQDVSMDGDDNNIVSSKDNALILDSQMGDAGSMPMDENSFSNDANAEQANDVAMEENTLLMEDDDNDATLIEEENALLADNDGQRQEFTDIDDMPMEENILLNPDENMDERNNVLEDSEITIDENNLLDENTSDNLVFTNPISENVLLEDSESTNVQLETSDVRNQNSFSAMSGENENADLNESNSELFSNGECDGNINRLETAQVSNEEDDKDEEGLIDNCVITDPVEDTGFGVDPHSVSDTTSSSVVIEDYNQPLNNESETLNDLLEDESYQVQDPNEEFAEKELNEDSQESLQVENEIVTDYGESIVKEEVIENDYVENDILGKTNELDEDNPDYELSNLVVKEEMADIETLVDVKQEVLEESDHLAIDHSVKQEFLDTDAVEDEYLGDGSTCDGYYNDNKGGKPDNFTEVVPIALNKSSEFINHGVDDMVVPASMIIRSADLKNMRGKNLNPKEEIIISDKCVDVTKLKNLEMDVETEGDSLLAPRSFACSICHREYQSIATLQRHEKFHENEVKPLPNVRPEILETAEVDSEPVEGMYKCTCKKTFKRRSSVLACIKSHRVRGIYCEYCLIPFRRRRELRSHLVKAHMRPSNEGKPKCTICNKFFAHNRSLLRHSKLHMNEANDLYVVGMNNDKKHACELCNMEFTSETEFSMHRSVAHPLSPHADLAAQSKPNEQPSLKLKFNCKICKKVFLTLGALTGHKAVHSKNKKSKFQCERCQESFPTRSELSSHRRLHCRGVLHHYSALQYIADREVVKKQVKCDVCTQTYSSKEDMEAHRDATHPFVTFSKEDATETRIFFK